MDEDAAKENPPPDFNKIDLSQLQGFSFGTQWTKDRREPERGSDRPGRPERRDPGNGPSGAPSRDRRAFRRPAGPLSDGGGEAPRRGGGPAPRPAPRDEAPYDSPHFATTFYPEDTSFNALVKTIRASCRTIELFEIARTVLGKPERFTVFVTRRSASAPPPARGGAPEPATSAPAPKPDPIYLAVPDGLPFETEEAAIAHVMERHLGRFFDRADVEVEPPKGNFQVINRCSVTGELLGPPNYHRYSQIVQQHHAARIRHMPLEAYRNRIETVRDPEVVKQWLEKMKKGVRYTWKVPVPASAEPPSSASSTSSATGETPPVSAALPSAPEAEPNATPAAEPSVSTAAVEAPPAATPPVTESAPLKFDALEEARQHLLSQARERVVRPSTSARFHGRELADFPAGEIRRAVEGALERQRRFPLDTANALRGRLRREHFTIFKKGSKGISYVCAVKRKFRVPGQTLAEGIGTLIAFIEAHPMVKAGDLAGRYLGIAAPAEGSGAEPTPTAEERDRLARLHADLHWLVREGYVTEFIDGGLYAPPPVPEARKAEAEAEALDPENFPEAPAEDVPSETAPEAPAPVPAEAPVPDTGSVAPVVESR